MQLSINQLRTKKRIIELDILEKDEMSPEDRIVKQVMSSYCKCPLEVIQSPVGDHIATFIGGNLIYSQWRFNIEYQ